MSAGALIEEPRVSRLSDGWLETDSLESTDSIRTSELISALSYALDLTEGRSMGHSVRTCVIGMRLAQHVGLSMKQAISTTPCSSRTRDAAATSPAVSHFECG